MCKLYFYKKFCKQLNSNPPFLLCLKTSFVFTNYQPRNATHLTIGFHGWLEFKWHNDLKSHHPWIWIASASSILISQMMISSVIIPYITYHFRLACAVGCWFAPCPGLTKDHHYVINGTNCLPACVMVGVWQCSLTLKGQVVCGTLLGHVLKRSPGINRKSRILYPWSDFYLVLHGLQCGKSTTMN